MNAVKLGMKKCVCIRKLKHTDFPKGNSEDFGEDFWINVIWKEYMSLHFLMQMFAAFMFCCIIFLFFSKVDFCKIDLTFGCGVDFFFVGVFFCLFFLNFIFLSCCCHQMTY